MKVKALTRTERSVSRECKGDVRKHHRNLQPQYHPMQRAREYTRAVTSSKMDRMFAKPFVGDLGQRNGHSDAVLCAAICRKALSLFVSGSADGRVKLWDLTSRAEVAELQGHSQRVNGVVFDNVGGRHFYSCGNEGKIQCWSVRQDNVSNNESSTGGSNPTPPQGPVETFRLQTPLQSIDHDWSSQSRFCTASSESVDLWDPSRTSPIQSHKNLWGSADTVQVVRYNPAESHLVGICSADRGVGILDTRVGVALRKTVLRMRSNCLEWNPMEPMNFVVGNEDYNAYQMDMRNLTEPSRIYKGHTSAILSVSWSPTGKEFVTGSYDKTIRIFSQNRGTCRDVYHTKRMQRVQTVHYTMDNRFILSGSDEGGLRLWKARANEQLSQPTVREEAALSYRTALVERYRHMPEVARIQNSRKIPRVIQKQTAQAKLQKEKAERKQENRIQHSRPGKYEHVSERKKIVVKEVK